MKVYVIYKFDNKKNVDRVIKNIEEKNKAISENNKIHIFRFHDQIKRHWKNHAKRKIKEANIVLFFDSITEDVYYKNLKWELDVAEKYKKKIVVIKQHNKELSSKIYHFDYAENQLTPGKYKKVEECDLVNYLVNESTWNMRNSLIKTEKELQPEGETNSNDYYNLLLQQYKIMIDTSEKLMERRLTTSNLYTTLCSSLLTLSSASLAINFTIASLVFLVVGMIIFFLSLNWKNLLASYEMNNAGKYEVINSIEANLPANMFDCEYRYNTFNGIKSYSSREKQLPTIFMALGLIASILGLVLLVIQCFNLF